MTWGKKLRSDNDPDGAMLRKKRDRGDDMPFLDNRPIIPSHLAGPWDAFWRLEASRPSGGSMSGIDCIPYPWIILDAEYFGPEMCRSELEEWVRVVQYVDILYRTRANEEIEKKSKRK